MRTAFDHESVGPKSETNLAKAARSIRFGLLLSGGRLDLGLPRVVQVVERESSQYSRTWYWMIYGNVSEPGKGCRCPGKSSLFFLTCERTMETHSAEIWLDPRYSTPLFGVRPVRIGSSLKILGKYFVFNPGRTHNRSRSPRFEASGP